MSWSGLGSLDGVSKSNLQNAVDNSVFALKNTITGDAGNQVTKTEAHNLVYLDVYNSTFAAKSGSDVVVKQDLTPSVCKVLRVTVDFTDLSSSDDFKVYFRFTDCAGTVTVISYDTNLFDHNSGYCFKLTSGVQVFIIQFGVEQPASFSGYSDGGYCDILI